MSTIPKPDPEPVPGPSWPHRRPPAFLDAERLKERLAAFDREREAMEASLGPLPNRSYGDLLIALNVAERCSRCGSAENVAFIGAAYSGDPRCTDCLGYEPEPGGQGDDAWAELELAEHFWQALAELCRVVRLEARAGLLGLVQVTFELWLHVLPPLGEGELPYRRAKSYTRFNAFLRRFKVAEDCDDEGLTFLLDEAEQLAAQRLQDLRAGEANEAEE